MSVAAVRKELLKNVPNISKFGATVDAGDGNPATHEMIYFQGHSYSVPMSYVLHTDCGKRLRGLYSRAEYNRMHSAASRRAATPILIYCPTCGSKAGKHIRRQVRNQGRPYTFHSPGGIPGGNRYVSSYFIFPKGVGYDFEGNVTSVSTQFSRRMDDDEVEMPYDPEA